MLRSTRQLYGYKLQATDDEIGEVEDFYFDDASWKVRYLVVETGGWLGGREVLLSVQTLGEPNWLAGILPVGLSAEQVKNSPPTDRTRPVSEEHEQELAGHYGWDYYRLALQASGPSDAAREDSSGPRPAISAPELRSTREIGGYKIRALDGDIGVVDDFLIDDRQWLVRYLVVDTIPLLPSKHVLIATPWIERVDWAEGDVVVDLPREMIKASPEYDSTAPPERAYEEALHDYYARPKYWL